MSEEHISVRFSVVSRRSVEFACGAFLLLYLMPFSLSLLPGGILFAALFGLLIAHVELWKLDCNMQEGTFCFHRLGHKPLQFTLSSIQELTLIPGWSRGGGNRLFLCIRTDAVKIRILLGKPTEEGFEPVSDTYENALALYDYLQTYLKTEETAHA